MDPKLIRSWNHEMGREFPGENPGLAHYKKGPYELFYAAVGHQNEINGPTLTLVRKLFEKYDFNVVIIEPIRNDMGKSPKWYLDMAKRGIEKDVIVGGEGTLSAILADQKKIPFIGGEPSDKIQYERLRADGYTDLDIVGFVLVRQIPQWVRERENKTDLIDRKGPDFNKNYCAIYGILNCPSVQQVKVWFKSKTGEYLTPDVPNENFAPHSDGNWTQQISASLNDVRNAFTLRVIESSLQKYKKVAVVYGASHLIMLRKSLDQSLGEPSWAHLDD